MDPSVCSHPGYLSERDDVRSPRRHPPLSSFSSTHRRLGKDDKLAQEADLPFTVRVRRVQRAHRGGVSKLMLD